MIISKEPYEYRSGKGLRFKKIGYKWTFQCDNPDCKKVFVPKVPPTGTLSTTISRLRKRAHHYCCHPCSTSVVLGVCKEKDCNQPILGDVTRYRQIDSGLCKTHHKKFLRKHNYPKFKASRNKQVSSRGRANRLKMFEMLGNQCVCCGEKDNIYFQIDHIHNDATVRMRSVQLRDYLREPDRYQLLCANCNHAKRMNGGVLYMRPAVAA